MKGKKEGLTGQTVRPEKCGTDGRDQQHQYKHLTRFEQHKNNPGQYRRAVRRMMAGAFVMAQDFPARVRFSYVVDRHGKLIPGVERRAAGR